ncbi:MAG: hypothetical protein ACRETB_11330 [Steroidobacteraceae bacterium]
MTRPASVLVTAGLLLGAAAWAQMPFKSPQSVRLGLSVMSQVVANCGRLIAAGHYAEIPAQANELEAGIASLQRGLGDQPQPFESQLVPLIAQLRVASGALREAATHHRESMLPVVRDQLAETVQSIVALFPENLRPVAHGNPQPAGHANGG